MRGRMRRRSSRRTPAVANQRRRGRLADRHTAWRLTGPTGVLWRQHTPAQRAGNAGLTQIMEGRETDNHCLPLSGRSSSFGQRFSHSQGHTSAKISCEIDNNHNNIATIFCCKKEKRTVKKKNTYPQFFMERIK